MRQVENPQRQFGQVDIADIVLDSKSRDDIPQLLRGLQHIYCTPGLRAEVFETLQQVIPRDADGNPVSADNGRPGMEQWKILVLGVLRLGINTDYDRLHELANQHNTVRQFLGHSDWSDETTYSLQQLRNNLRLFTPEILDQINQAVVRNGHTLVKKSQTLGQPTLNSWPAATRSWWRPMCTTPPISTCCGMLCANSCRTASAWPSLWN